MRKKITMLLASMLVCIGAMAQITVGSVYSIQNKNTGNAISQDANNKLATVQANTADNAQLWLVEEGSAEGTFMFRNLKSGMYAQYVDATYTLWYTDFVEKNFYVGEMSAAAEEEDVPAYYYISLKTISDIATASYSVMHQSNGYVVRWEQTNNSSQWAFVGVEVADLAAISETWKAMETTKTVAVSELENLAKLSAVYPDATEEIAAVNAVTATGTSAAELNTAAESIKTILANYKKEADGKNVKLCNHGSDGRAGKYLGYDKTNARAAAVASTGDDVIWTLKACGDGTFKLYNFVNNLYLGAPADQTPTYTNEADAPSFNFISTDSDKGALVCSNGNMVHVATHSNFKVISYYSLTDEASLWTVTATDPIVVTREVYDNAEAAKVTLPYAIQEAYGLVTDAANYYSNWLSTAEGSYAALLDNASDTYFHSAYTNEATSATAETHYIQADLGESNSVDEFYFYMAPRTQNSNNRPSNVTVSGSNDNSEYTPIAEITTTLDGTTTPYFSAKLGTDGTNYRYIRLTVNSTNNDTKFFTLSELYFFPATDDVTSLIESYNSFATASITETVMTDAANALINAETTLALANIKKEIAVILEANESNHAETPALGQYTTEAYNALNTAYTAGDATQESLEAAIAAFNASLNSPVYFITSAHTGYAAGSAIYYDGEWKWKAANKFDRQMWMTIPDYTEENVPVVDAYDANGISYEICDYLTGTVMRDKSVQIVKIANWNGVYNLQYAEGANNTDAAQHAKDNGKLVNWTPATTTDAQASAWQVEYIGNTHDLKNLTDECIAALAALQGAYDAKAYCAEVEIGSGVGQYTGDKNAVVDVLNAGKVILDKSLSEQATLDLAEINSAAEAIEEASALQLNMPQTGFYRVKSMNANDENKRGKYWQVNADATALELNATMDEFNSIVYYADDKTILNYGTGLFLNNYNTPLAVGEEAKSWTIAANNKVLGAYALYRNGDGYCLSDWSGLTYGQNDENAAWALEAVEVLPLKVLAAGYATLYAPVALTIPAEGVAVYTATVEGTTLTLNPVEGTIPANTGVIIEAAEGTYNFTVATDVAAIEGNAFTGALAKSAKNANAKVYTLQAPAEKEVGFYLFKGTDGTNTTYINGFRAWVELPLDATVQGLRITRGDTEDTTGIEQLAGDNAEVVIYDLAGRRVAKMEKGIYIVNGKKVVVK